MSHSDCLFCKIAAKQIPAKVLHEDDEIFVIADINPQAPLHALVIPRKHIETLNDLSAADDALVGKMMRRAAAIAKEHGYADRGYRTAFNTNADAGQAVFHIHLHVLAGRTLRWPPG
jgi:histidine triad (HIT) family protein